MIWSYSLPWYGGFRQLELDENRLPIEDDSPVDLPVEPVKVAVEG